MAIEVIPEWMMNLDDEDVSFIKKVCFIIRFFKASSNPIRCDLSYCTIEIR